MVMRRTKDFLDLRSAGGTERVLGHEGHAQGQRLKEVGWRKREWVADGPSKTQKKKSSRKGPTKEEL